MKTWWDFLGVIILALVVPLLIAVAPTVEINGKFLGGGVVRQWVINNASNFLPVETANFFVSKFENATAIGEAFLFLPFAVNISAALLLIIFCIGNVIINVQNFISTSKFQSQRKKAKGI